MKLLLDTNVILEVLLDQKNRESVENLFEELSDELIYLSDFSLHSIGVILFNEGEYQSFQEVLHELVQSGFIHILSFPSAKLSNLSGYAKKYDLDFDDAYQYALAKHMGLTLITFDSDFDRTPIDSQTPSDVLS